MRGACRTSKCVIATGGCYTDTLTLHKLLTTRVKMYNRDHQREMSSGSIARLLSHTLYGRRFFPYYTFNIIAGVDADGATARLLSPWPRPRPRLRPCTTC